MSQFKRPTSENDAMRVPSPGHAALDTYAAVLTFLAQKGSQQRQDAAKHPELHFIKDVAGVENLYRTMSAIAPAVPDAHDEEWNPLSQRPHSPLPPAISDELGAEISSLKEAVDAFTTLSHEMMHVALCEPIFTGTWRPRNQASFRDFFLMSEGFCFFFADIVVSGAVRVRLPDGEFALDRETPSNSNFHPIRAFHALGIQDQQKILDIYLNGFSGRRTSLVQQHGTNDFAAALAIKIHTFYAHSQPYLKELYKALHSFGGLTEFYQRFCAIPGLPSFLSESTAQLARGSDLKLYFEEFFQSGLTCLGQLTPAQTSSIRWRRMMQMRAFYALQVRWFLSEGQVIAQGFKAPLRKRLLDQVELYLDGLRALLLQLGQQPDVSPAAAMMQLDAQYETQVRAYFLTHHVWAGHRWLIAPSRAGGYLSVFDKSFEKTRGGKKRLLDTAEYLVEELAARMPENATVASRAETLAHIQQMAAIGATAGHGTLAQVRTAAQKLRQALSAPQILSIWSLPLASFDPVKNQYRELLFSYK